MKCPNQWWDLIAWTIKDHPNQSTIRHYKTLVLWCLHTLTHHCTNLFELSPLMSWIAMNRYILPPWARRQPLPLEISAQTELRRHCVWMPRWRTAGMFYDFHWFSNFICSFFGITPITTPERQQNALLCGGELGRNVTRMSKAVFTQMLHCNVNAITQPKAYKNPQHVLNHPWQSLSNLYRKWHTWHEYGFNLLWLR